MKQTRERKKNCLNRVENLKAKDDIQNLQAYISTINM